MNCANHPDRERVSFCQNCGKPLCQECARVVGASVYCEPCLAARLAGADPGATSVGSTTMPPPPLSPDVPSPALATLLGFIPGVGAMYNGQYAKGIVHLIVFAVLASLGGIFKIFTLGWIVYQAIDANHTARARLAGAPLPNPFGLNDIGERLGFGKTWPVPPPAPGTTGHPPADSATFTADPSGNVAYTSQYPGPNTPPAASYVPPASSYGYTAPPPAPNWGTSQEYNPTMPPTQSPYAPYAPINPGDATNPFPPQTDPMNGNRFPAGAIWLIAIGSLFLLTNLGIFHGFPVRHLFPVLLIGFGVWLFVRRMTLPTPVPEPYNLRVFRALRSSIWVVLAGVLILVDSFGVISWSHSWPLFLIVAGALALLKNTAYSGLPGGAYSYAAYPPPPAAPATAAAPPPDPTSIVPYEPTEHNNQEGR